MFSGLSEVWHRLAGLRTALLALLIPIAAYAWYVSVHWGRINDFNQRELAQGARILETTLANAVTNVEHLTPKGIPGFLAEQPYVRKRDLPASTCPKIGRPKLSSGEGKGLFIAAETGKGCRLELEFDTARLFSELAIQDSFSSIFLVDAKGKVIVQVFDAGQRQRQGLRLIETAVRPSVETTGPVRLSDLSRVVGSTQQEFDKIKGASARLRAILGGEYHQVYLTPIRFNVDSTAEFNETWVLGAIVPQDQLLRSAFAVDTYLLGAVVMLALAAALGWPLLKIAMVGAHERFRMWDVYRVYLSTASVLTLCSVAVFGVEAYWQYDSIAREGLAELSEQLESNLAREIGQARQQLEDWDTLYEKRPTPKMVCLDLHVPAGKEACKPFAPPDRFANVQQVAWIEPGGKQVAKVTTDKSSPDLFDVSHRPYYLAISDRLEWRLIDGGRAFFLHPLRSITDGRFYTFLSMESRAPLKHEKAGFAGRPPVVVMTLDLSSLGEQPLPAGYGFALINRQGDVLYHSDSRLSLRQNVFEEVTAATRMRALVVAGQQEAVSSGYRSRQHEFHLRPVTKVAPRHLIAEIPAWYLVTFRDLAIPRSIAIRTLAVGLIGLIVLSQILLGLPLLVMAIVSKRYLGSAGAWLWPLHEKAGSYRLMVLALAILWAIAIVAPSSRAPIAVAIPWIAVAIRAIQIRSSTASLRRTPPAVGWHLAALVMLGIHVAVFPAFYMFQLAWNHEFSKLQQLEEQRLKISSDDILTKAWLAALRQEAPPSRANALRRERRRFLATPFLPFRLSGADAGETTGLLRPYEWLARQMPLQTELQVKLAYVGGKQGNRVFTAWTWATAASLAVLLGLLVLWIRIVATRLFLPGLAANPLEQAPEGGWEKCWNDLPDVDKLLIAHVHEEGVANPRQSSRVADLVRRGILTFHPGIQPVAGLRDHLAMHRPAPEAVKRWETVDVPGGWKQARWVLIAGVAAVSVFVFATQPELPGEISGFIAFMTGIASGVIKLREHFGVWLKAKDNSASR